MKTLNLPRFLKNSICFSAQFFWSFLLLTIINDMSSKFKETQRDRQK